MGVNKDCFGSTYMRCLEGVEFRVRKYPGRYQWGRGGGEGMWIFSGDRVSVQEGGKLGKRMVVKVAQ